MSTPVISVETILTNKHNACAFTNTFTSCKDNIKTKTRIHMPIIIMALKLNTKPNVRLTQVAIAMTTAGGTAIQAAMISHDAKKPTCLFIPTVL